MRHFYSISIYVGVTSPLAHTATRRQNIVISRKLKFDFLHIYSERTITNWCAPISCVQSANRPLIGVSCTGTHTPIHPHAHTHTRTSYAKQISEWRACVCVCVNRSSCCQFSSSVGEEVEPLLVIGPSQLVHMRIIAVHFIEFFPAGMRSPHHSKSWSVLKGTRTIRTPLQRWMNLNGEAIFSETKIISNSLKKKKKKNDSTK